MLKNVQLVMFVIVTILVIPVHTFQMKSTVRYPRSSVQDVSCSSSPSSLKYRMGNDEVDLMIQNPEKFRRRMFLGREKEFEKVDKQRSLNAVETAFGRVFMIIFTVDIVREYFTGHSFVELIATDLGLPLPGL